MIVLAVWLLLVCSITLLAAGALYSDTVATAGLRNGVLDAPAGQRSIVVRAAPGVRDLAGTDAVVRDELERTMGRPGGETALVARSGSYVVSGGDPDATGAAGGEGAATDPNANLTLLAAYEGLERHASLESGRWPEAGHLPVEAALSVGAAAALGLEPGDRVRVASRRDPGRSTALVVTGTWLGDPGDPYWLGDPLELNGIETRGSFTTRGPVVVAPEDLLAPGVAADVEHQWRALPYAEALEVDDVDPLLLGIDTLDERLTSALPPGQISSVTSGLPPVLEEVDQSVVVGSSSALVVIAQFAILAGYAVILVAGMVVERRRAETALVRSRGATRGQVAQLALLESLMLTTPAVLLAPFLALAVVRVIVSIGPLADAGLAAAIELGTTPVVVAVLAGIFCAIALTLPAAATISTPAAVRAALGRQVGTTLAQRMGIDLALLLFALLALWQLRLYGAPLTRDLRGTIGVDPLLVATPAIGLLAGAVLAVRIVPRIGELADRLLSRRPGLVGALGGRELARRPLRHSRSALLLVLAVALGLFAAAYSATWTQSQSDQAAYQAVADVRVLAPTVSGVPSWTVGEAYRRIDGVEDATGTDRQSVDVGRAVVSGQLLAIEPEGAAAVMRLPDDPASQALPSMVAALDDARSVPEGVAVQGEPVAFRIVVDARLTSRASGTDEILPGAQPTMAGAVTFEDADGRLHRVLGDRVPGRRGEVVLEVPLGADDDAAGAAYPLQLRAVDLVLAPPSGVSVVGRVDLRDVEAVSGDPGGATTPIALDPADPNLRWLRIDTSAGSRAVPYTPPAGSPGRIELGANPEDSPPIDPGITGATTVFRLGVAPDGTPAIPGIVGQRFALQTGVVEGDTIAISVQGTRLPMQVVGLAEAFPPLDPAEPFVVLDLPSFERLRFDSAGLTAPASEWWLATADGAAATVADELQASPQLAASVIDRASLEASLAGSALPLAVIGALLLGSAAALVFAALGLVVSAAVSTGERLGEFALLRALGLSGRQLSTWLSLENAFLLGVGLVAGSALGLMLAWLVLPLVMLSPAGEPVVPVISVVVPWPALVPIYALSAGLLILIVAVVRRELLRLRVSDVLRARDG
jgi:hypothetical protein